MGYSLDCEYAHGGPLLTGLLRASEADFQVDEELGFEPSGQGEHDFIQLRKTGLNTAQLAKQVAEVAGVKPMDVGYAGLKDRHAVTTQWFSVYRPKGEAPDWKRLQNEHVELLAVARHHQKLRRGQHAANHFKLVIRDCSGNREKLPDLMRLIEAQGVPNYFGPQRFGFAGGNLEAAQRLLVEKKPVRNRQLKGLYLSAARSYLFNQVLRERVRNDSWRTLIPGDVPVSGDHSAPTAPLWGRGRLATGQDAAELETAVAGQFSDWCHGLEHAGLKQERRPLCLPVTDLKWSVGDSEESSRFSVAFSLPVGGYATSVLREIVDYREPERHNMKDNN